MKRTHPQRLWVLGICGVVPGLLLGVFGLYSLRRENDLALLDARSAAKEQSARLADGLMRALVPPALPGEAELQALESNPGSPETDPVRSLGEGTLARFFGNDTEYPKDPGSVVLPFAADLARFPSELTAVWARAEAADRRRDPQSGATTLWAELQKRVAGTPWESLVGYRLGRSLVFAGRTPEAVPVLEAVVRAEPGGAGETGLPLDVLALRSLLQAAEVDRAAAASQTRWLDWFCQRVLIRWRLGEGLLAEWEGLDPERLRRWRELATLHEQIRTAIPEQPASTQPAWQEEESGRQLRSVHEVAGGVWVLMRSEAAVSNRVLQALQTEVLPAGVRAVTTILGRRIGGADESGGLNPAGEELGEAKLSAATYPDSSVRLVLVDADGLQARSRWRVRIFGSLIALASATSIVAVVAAVRAYERQRRLASLQSDFVASVTHELRAPLAAVRLMAEELVDLPPESTQQRTQYHRLILRETQRLGMLIENVLRHARLERGSGALDLAEVDLREVVERSVESLRPCAEERDLRLATDLPAVPVWADVDAQALQQVVVNLVDNALKHSPTGAEVRVGVVAASPDDPTVRAGSDPGRATLWVSDEGAGIPAAEQARIFESFYRRGTELRRETSGVGLGLALVKRIVEAHHGTVAVQSRPGAGARFSVEIPLAEFAKQTHED